MSEKDFCLWKLALEEDYFSTRSKLVVKASHLYLLLLHGEGRGCRYNLKSQSSRD